MRDKFDYGNYYIEYRKDRDGLLHFLKKKINDFDDAIKERHKLESLGYHEILIKRNNKNDKKEI